MRLTPETILQAEQSLNCIGDRELVLRNLAIPAIENMAVARDGFDTIDLSCNMISTLGDGFPPFPRLSSLYLGSNRITRIARGVADSLPNLRVLILTGNRLQRIDDLNLTELTRLPKLEVLSIIDNPVANEVGIREKLIKSIPNLKVLNFTKVTLGERKAAQVESSKPKRGKRKMANEKKKTSKRQRTGETGERETDKKNKGKKQKTLTTEQSQALREYIEKAESVEEVLRMQEAIRSGTAVEFLKAVSKESKLSIERKKTECG